jgi:hypothetical protein
MQAQLEGFMSAPTQSTREGNLEAPTRHPLDWKNPDFYDEARCSANWSVSSTSVTAAAAA